MAAVELPYNTQAIIKQIQKAPFKETPDGFVFAAEYVTIPLEEIEDEPSRTLIEDTLEQLNALCLTASDVETYVAIRKESPEIQKYLATIKSLTRKLIGIEITNMPFCTLEHGEDAKYYQVVNGTREELQKLNSELRSNTGPQAKKVEKVLNHRNPFADISISGHLFLYAASNKTISAIQFEIGHEIGNENGTIVARPIFRIHKEDNLREIATGHVQFDETLVQTLENVDDTNYVFLNGEES